MSQTIAGSPACSRLDYAYYLFTHISYLYVSVVIPASSRLNSVKPPGHRRWLPLELRLIFNEQSDSSSVTRFCIQPVPHSEISCDWSAMLCIVEPSFSAAMSSREFCFLRNGIDEQCSSVARSLFRLSRNNQRTDNFSLAFKH